MKFQTLFFTLYGDYIINASGTISVKSLIKIMKEFGFSEGAVRAGLFRLKQKGLIEMIDKKRCRLSESGLFRLEEGMRRVYDRPNDKWDGKWRIVIYNIPENNRSIRDQLRKTLIWLGFGYLTQSVWVSPNPVEDTLKRFIDEIKSKNTEVEVHMFLAEYIGDPKDIVKKCWNLNDVEKKYKEFIGNWKDLLNSIEKLKPNEAFITRIRLVHEYRKFLHIDPNLPRDLLPENWIGYEAKSLFQELREKLTPLSDKFFYSVYEP
jgi:phenylacetic acid degradation operon negative regulatory protein